MAVNINIPSQVKTYANLAAFPASGSLKTIYIAEDTNKTYRWTGSVYVEISASAAMTWGQIGGTLSNQTDLQNALDAKVPTSRTLTINGVTQDLSANRTFTISTGITIGSTAITSGTVGRILFEGAGNVVQESSSLFWDATNNRLGIGTSSPARTLDVQSAQPVVRVLSTTNTNYSALVFNNFAGDFWVGRESSSGNSLGMTAPAYAGVINARGNYPLYIGRNDFNNITISTNNNVLINTTTDAGFRLDVNGTARVKTDLKIETATGGLIIEGDASGYPTLKINTLRSGTTRRNWMFATEQINGGDFILFRSATAGGVANTLVYSIFNDGNFGLNTSTNAGFRLDVNGTGRFTGNVTLDQLIANQVRSSFFNTQTNSFTVFRAYTATGNAAFYQNVSVGTTSEPVASAVLQADSTTKGFLPPRMTTTQINAIASPAEGLMVYNTTISHMCVYQAGSWVKLSHSPM